MIVVTDTSVVLNSLLAPPGVVALRHLRGVLAPEQVRLEFGRKAATDPRFTGLIFPPFITVAQPVVIPSALASNTALDPGEIVALALALERGIADVLIDESPGRTAALALGLHVSGLIGVLIEGKHRNLVPALRPLPDRLVTGARFWLADRLRERVLRSVGETP